MRIDSRDLQGLPVATETGQRLGKILSFDVDVEQHAVTCYHVGPRNWPGGLRYEIVPQQVLSITAEQMTVQDAVVVAAEAAAMARAPAVTVSPMSPRSE